MCQDQEKNIFEKITKVGYQLDEPEKNIYTLDNQRDTVIIFCVNCSEDYYADQLFSLLAVKEKWQDKHSGKKILSLSIASGDDYEIGIDPYYYVFNSLVIFYSS